MDNLGRCWVLIGLMVLCVSWAWAQQTKEGGVQPVQPVPPLSPGETTGSAEQTDLSRATPDTTPASGAEQIGLGARNGFRNYILPSFQVSEMADTNFSLGPGPQKFETVDSLVGRLAAQRVGKQAQTTLDYAGGAWIINRHSDFDSTIHQLGITQSFTGRRAKLVLDDRATYLPESSFGFGGFGWSGGVGSSLGIFGTNLAGLNPIFNPNQMILTGRGSRISNAAVAQVEFLAGPRSTITLAGSYDFLHFRKSGFLDSNNAAFIGGYDRTLTARDTLGVSYALSLFRFKHLSQRFNTHIVELNYGHRITGRLALELGAGPQISVFSNRLAGSDTHLSWTARSALRYRLQKTDFGITYARYTSNGGGLLVGAQSDIIQMTWGWRFWRNWSGSLGPGYAHNKNLKQTTPGVNNSVYNSAFVGASLSRDLGRYTTIFFNYNFQTQRSDISPCFVGNCGTSLLRHVFGFGFDWHPRQIAID